jgi:hypothetical protein
MDVHKTSTDCIVATMSNTLLIWANTYMQMCERLGETNKKLGQAMGNGDCGNGRRVRYTLRGVHSSASSSCR